jgi:hypothetical protein
MSRDSKVLFSMFFFVALIFCAATFYRYVIKQDYYILTQDECDPKTQSCFERKCGDLWWFECTGDPASDIQIYRYIQRKAYDFPYCDPVVKQEGFLAHLVEAKECPIPACDPSDSSCSVIYCDPAKDNNCFKPEEAATSSVSMLTTQT